MDRPALPCSHSDSYICAELETHVLDAADDERARWVARRLPADRGCWANWWLHLLLVMKYGVEQRAEARLRWTRLYLWAVRHATGTGALSTHWCAIATAVFVGELRDGQFAAEVADALPSADAIVQACLAQLPFALDAIPDATDLRLLDIATIRRSRQAKNLVKAAAWHEAQVQDPAVASQLRSWIEALPRLA